MSIYNDILYDFQKKIVDIATKRDRFFLAMEPGTGKTFTSLSIAQELGYKKILVVCQKSKKLDWKMDIEKHLGLETHLLGVSKKKDEQTLEDFESGAIISNYETVRRRDIKLDESFILIIDESQYLKSRTSKIGKWGVKASKKCKNLLLLSGTPQNEPEDLYNQMVMLGMNLKWKEFLAMFCLTEMVKYPIARFPKEEIVSYKNLDIFYKAFKWQSVTIKTDEVLDLPEQNFIIKHLEHKNIKKYRKILRDKVYQVDDRVHLIESGGIGFMRARQMSSGFYENETGLSTHKIDALDDLFESNDKNLVIFYNFNQELEDIKTLCKKKGIKVFESNGHVSDEHLAEDCKDRFVILGQYQSSAEGKNWQFVSHQVYYSLPVSYMKWKQSLARVHRIGQKKKVFYHIFKTKGTIEDKIFDSLKKGEDYNKLIFDKDFN